MFKKRFDSNYEGFFKYIRVNWKKVLIIIVCSIFYAFGQVHFMMKAGSVLDGVEAISVSMAYIIPVLKPYLTVLYLALNIPLIIFFWRRVKKAFIITTLIFLFFNAIFGFIFGFEPVDNFISSKIIVLWQNGTPNNDVNANIDLGWPIFVYVILAVACCSPSAAIVWKLGSSTGGTDLIAYYISSKLKKPVGTFLMLTGTLMATIGILFLYLSKKFMPTPISSNIIGFNHILGGQTFGTYLYILLNGFVINLIYPKYNKVVLKIDTKEIDSVIDFLQSINFWHPYKIKSSISGYNKETVYSIESIVLLLESDDIAKKIKNYVPDAWISITPISRIYGRFDYSRID
ncbi:MAG: YitT family protein [Mycoplasma sp.]|nr:YitT family protein [Mycoplasma sp.]